MTPTASNPDSEALYSTQLGTTGPRVAFCHGLFGQGKNWTSIAKGLSATFRVTLVDLPNHGRSGWTDHFSYPAMADSVGDLLVDQSGGEPWAVVGHSMGGKVAMALALTRPDLVERLCVVDISPVRYPSLSTFAGFIHGMQALDLGWLTDRSEADEALKAHVQDPTVRSFLLQNLRRDGQRWRWQMNLELLGDQLGELGDWPELDPTAFAGAPYAGPVLWIAGAESGYVKPEYAPAMRQLFPRVRLVTVKGAGHWVHSEQPEVFLGALRKFLTR